MRVCMSVCLRVRVCVYGRVCVCVHLRVCLYPRVCLWVWGGGGVVVGFETDVNDRFDHMWNKVSPRYTPSTPLEQHKKGTPSSAQGYILHAFLTSPLFA